MVLIYLPQELEVGASQLNGAAIAVHASPMSLRRHLKLWERIMIITLAETEDLRRYRNLTHTIRMAQRPLAVRASCGKRGKKRAEEAQHQPSFPNPAAIPLSASTLYLAQ